VSLGCGAEILVFERVGNTDIPNYFRMENTCATEIVNWISMRYGVDKDSLDITLDENDKITGMILQNGKPISLVGWDEEL